MSERIEHRVFRQIHRGPLFAGVPILIFFSLIAAMALGFFVLKLMGGIWVGLGWVLTLLMVWGVLAFLFSQDSSFLSRLSLRLSLLVLRIRVLPRVDSMCPGTQRVTLKQ